MRKKLLIKFPLSIFLIFGFTFTQFYLPLIFTFLERKPVVHNLLLPYQVFLHMFLDFFILVVAHKIYRSNYLAIKVYVRTILKKWSFFKTPSDKQIWIIGVIGIAATFYVYIYTKAATQVTGSAFNKLIEAMIPYSYAPFFIPLGKLYGNARLYKNRTTIFLVVFTIILFVISVSRNSRGAFMYGFTAIGFGYTLGLLLGYYKTPPLKITRLIAIVFACWIFTNPLADLGTAMVITRAQRADISSLELFENTLKIFEDKNAIVAKRKEDQNLEQSTWNENYINNIFLARFCNIKYNDLSLIQANKVIDSNDDILEFTLSRILLIFPAPIVEGLGLIENKRKSIGYSFGDFLYAKATSDFDMLGANLAGHLDGTGMAAFGWFYLLFLGIGIIPVYALFDAFFIHTPILVDPKKKYFIWQGHFSLCGLLALTSIFQFLPSESVVTTATFILRIWIQMIFLYFILYKFSFIVSRFF
ncbi:hypothetical protein [Spirosoma foliorum]|uniref:O-antigen polysaccharide polymerase Wzy n=1 Tax=Spirosoma foliorum TaxID=2710596 RepID=A0A7G5GYN3_9BACT|nr:hypothetical protein [Spirosoma foliorum]QMW03975.1 hypothetical protein H3H32_03180 [Spirosoma foliorum]